ncbi:hypothetical protein S83_048064, partial [Arachis hypogaea]
IFVEASEEAHAVTSTFRTLLKRKYRPQLSIGFGSNASLFSSFITNGTLLVATVISMFLVDKFSRRKFFL